MSAGLTFRIVGGYGKPAGRYALAALIADSVSLTAPSIGRLKSNCRVIWRVAERARRRHLGEARDLAELQLERRCHRGRHGLRVGARQLRRDRERRIVDVRQRRHRQQRIGDQTADQQARPSAARSRSAAG